MVTKVIFHLIYLKSSQISHTYLKFFSWLENLIKIHLEYYEKYFLGIFYHITRSGIFHNFSIKALKMPEKYFHSILIVFVSMFEPNKES